MKNLASIVFIAGVLALTSCSSATKTNDSGGDTKKLKPYVEATLSNGLPVLLLEDKSLPYISYALMIKTGSAADPAGQSGLSNLVAGLLEKGTSQKSATKIADEFGQVGSEFSASVDEDYVYLSTGGLSTFREQLLSMFAEIVMTPSFNQAEIERYRKQILAGIIQKMDEPDIVAGRAFSSFLFGDHPYARSIYGDPKEISKIQKKDIIRHYLQYYRPNNAILTVVGQFESNIMSQLEARFGAWKSREVKPVEFPSVPAIPKVEIQLVEKSDLAQTQIVLGHAGIARNNPDFLTLRVANTILGTGFSSRLVNQIRDNLGLTYSISSDFDARKGIGPFVIATFTRHEKVGQTLTETFRLLKEFQQRGATPSEVTQAKGFLAGSYLRSVETAEKMAFNLLILRLYGIPDSYLTNFKANLDKVTVEDVNAVAKKYLKPDQLKVIVHSTPAAIDQINNFGDVTKKNFTEVH